MVYFPVVTVLQRTAKWAMMGENVYKKVWIINSSQAYSSSIGGAELDRSKRPSSIYWLTL